MLGLKTEKGMFLSYRDFSACVIPERLFVIAVGQNSVHLTRAENIELVLPTAKTSKLSSTSAWKIGKPFFPLLLLLSTFGLFCNGQKPAYRVKKVGLLISISLE